MHTWSWPLLHLLYQHALLLMRNILTITQIEPASDSEAAPRTALTEAVEGSFTSSWQPDYSLQLLCQLFFPLSAQFCQQVWWFEFSNSVMLLYCLSCCIFILRHQEITVCYIPYQIKQYLLLMERWQLACHNIRYLIYYSGVPNWFHFITKKETEPVFWVFLILKQMFL